jgi:heme-degrading monooxygenase HmoA
MHARVTTIEMDPERVDEVVSQIEERDLPSLRRMDGFKRFTLLLDRRRGRVVSVSLWKSEEHMAAAEDEVAGIRERAAETGGAEEPPAIERLEVALDTLAP